MAAMGVLGLVSVIVTLSLFNHYDHGPVYLAIILFWASLCLINGVIILVTDIQLYMTFKHTFQVIRREEKQILLFLFIFVVIYFV